MRLSLIVVVLGLSATVQLAQAAPEPAEVRTLKDLQAVSPLHLQEGWDVRLGIADPGPIEGPWKVIYCLTTWTGQGQPPGLSIKGSIPGDVLGPVFYSYSWQQTEPARDKVSAVQAKPSGDGAQTLYCGGVLLAWEGTCRVRVMLQSGEVIAESQIEVRKPAACYWHQFAMLRRQTGARNISSVVPPEAVAVWPRYSQQIAALAADPDGVLPLKLSLDDGVFLVRSDTADMVDWPDVQLLARWWVNDRPVVPARPDHVRSMQMGRMVGKSRQMTVALNLPDSLGTLKKGDRVAVQVLYMPGGYADVPKDRPPGMAQMQIIARLLDAKIPRPLLSNKLEFSVTEPMLAKPKPATTQAGRQSAIGDVTSSSLPLDR